MKNLFRILSYVRRYSPLAALNVLFNALTVVFSLFSVVMIIPFLQLLFGYRSLAELRYAYADVSANAVAEPLLDALFPARPSWVMPLSYE